MSLVVLAQREPRVAGMEELEVTRTSVRASASPRVGVADQAGALLTRQLQVMVELWVVLSRVA